MSQTCYEHSLREKAIRLGAMLVWGFLPALFIPFLPEPFETPKAIFFLAFTSILLLATCWNLYKVRIKGSFVHKSKTATFASKRLIKVVILWGGIILIASFRFANGFKTYWNYFPTDTWLINFVLVGFFIVLVLNFSGDNDVSLLIDVLLIGSLPVIAYCLIQLFHLDPFTWETDANSPLLSTLGRSTYVGGYMAAISPFMAFKGRTANRGRMLWFFSWAVLVVLTVFTFSRSAFLAISASTFLWIVFSTRQRIRVGILALFLMVWFVIAFQTKWKYTIHPQEPFWSQFDTQSSSNQPFLSLLGIAFGQRIYIWKEAWSLWLRHPWLGFGFGAFPKVFANEPHPALTQVGISPNSILHPHNLWLHLLISVGLIGTFTFVFVLFEGLRLILKQIKVSDKDRKLLSISIGISILVIMFLGWWNPLTLTHWMIFWGEIAMLALLDTEIQ